MKQKRLVVSLVLGAVLGIVCILGASVRMGGIAGRELFVLALWYNRVIMGLVVGLAGGLSLVPGKLNAVVRGAVLGLLVSLAFFLTSGLQDVTSFLAGIVYGVIIDVVAGRYGDATS
jgi:hypothetical protein